MEPKQRHLDINCGDGYFLKRSPCQECWRLDLISGGRFDDVLIFSNEFFDYVTMLAVLEHPTQVFQEVHRVLKPGGKFIFTTPKAKAEWLIHLYVDKEDLGHHDYFDRKAVFELSRGIVQFGSCPDFSFWFQPNLFPNENLVFGVIISKLIHFQILQLKSGTGVPI